MIWLTRFRSDMTAQLIFSQCKIAERNKLTHNFSPELDSSGSYSSIIWPLSFDFSHIVSFTFKTIFFSSLNYEFSFQNVYDTRSFLLLDICESFQTHISFHTYTQELFNFIAWLLFPVTFDLFGLQNLLRYISLLTFLRQKMLT